MVDGALIARAPVTALATPGAEQAGAEPLPGPRGVESVVPVAVRLPRMHSAAAAGSACDDAADRAELHRSHGWSVATFMTLVTLDCTPFDIAMSVSEAGGVVYSPSVLRLRGQTRTVAQVRNTLG